ncbi:winged helix DNA-binding protein [Streptomyces sp. 2333.5]|uniref:winged helix-turn-helix domain-containing protein n=1 Tax=Streptomyces TaxID=1883 RepID=UPI0008973CF2|nr:MULTISPECIES: transcriptional regulator [unclassified Streptomyces]PJJ05552.1 winged helix DNA-binding protein [Streptomyces sp. 2333.5]SEE78861.1 Winged helix DNA-binding domain-containing protein [Streptomyces sp. 2314.4]SEF00790.1 Winged helix DNA-binding domain-containing protein [Streptomyces sp. 2112.2]
MTNTSLGLDPVIHQLPKLSICALLAAGPQWVEFRTVREETGLSDSMVSKHSRALEDAGYIEIRKGGIGRRPRTWFRMTPLGQARYGQHVAALQRLLQQEPDQQNNSGA